MIIKLYSQNYIMLSSNKFSVCRLCLCENENLTDIFTENKWHGYIPAELIEDLILLKVSTTDDYPQVICSICMSKLSEFKIFKKQCETSKITYYNLLNSEKKEAEYQDQSDMVALENIKTEPEEIVNEDDMHTQEFHPTIAEKAEIITDDIPVEEDIAPIPLKLIEASTGKVLSPAHFGTVESACNAANHNICMELDVVQDGYSEAVCNQNEMPEDIGMEGETIISQRGKRKFVCNGYFYVFDKKSSDGTVEFWRCHRKDRCNCRIHTKNGIISKLVNGHSHEKSFAKVEAEKAVTKLRLLAAETFESTDLVLHECLSGLSPEAKGALQSERALRRIVKRRRKKVSSAVSKPTHLEISRGEIPGIKLPYFCENRPLMDNCNARPAEKDAFECSPQSAEMKDGIQNRSPLGYVPEAADCKFSLLNDSPQLFERLNVLKGKI